MSANLGGPGGTPSAQKRGGKWQKRADAVFVSSDQFFTSRRVQFATLATSGRSGCSCCMRWSLMLHHSLC
jgi:hypothetical protein